MKVVLIGLAVTLVAILRTWCERGRGVDVVSGMLSLGAAVAVSNEVCAPVLITVHAANDRRSPQALARPRLQAPSRHEVPRRARGPPTTRRRRSS